MPETSSSGPPNSVSAAPTKRFFISVLVKDIQFIDALVELVDNSVDSARSLKGGQDFTGIIIEIDHADGKFTIQDNARASRSMSRGTMHSGSGNQMAHLPLLEPSENLASG